MSTQEPVLIECNVCNARVQAKVLAEKNEGEYFDAEDNYAPARRTQFLECAVCRNLMIGYSEAFEDEGYQCWESAKRLWPDGGPSLFATMPAIVRVSFEEAQKCYSAKAYTACIVMAGRAIEGMCNDKSGAKYLDEGLRKIKDAGIIDQKLFDWGQVLRRERNIGAHAGEEPGSYQDASDVLDFAYAMAEYVYVLDEKFKQYIQRKSRSTAAPNANTVSGGDSSVSIDEHSKSENLQPIDSQQST